MKINKNMIIFVLCYFFCVFFTDAGEPVQHLKMYFDFNESNGIYINDKISGVKNIVECSYNDDRYKSKTDIRWIKSGVMGGALLFDGYSTFVDKPSSEITELKNGFTISLWVAPMGFEMGEEQNRIASIINQFDEKNQKGFNIGMGKYGSFIVEIGSGKKITKIIASHTHIPRNKWSYLTISYEKKEINMYLNGEKIANGILNDEATFVQAINKNMIIGKPMHPFRIIEGTNKNMKNGLSNMYNGIIDELMVFDRGLTFGEIRSLYLGFMKKIDGKTLELKWNEIFMSGRRIIDKNRVMVHADAPNGWLKRPCAPFYYEGKYHLFYESNPFGDFTNETQWGHLISDDLIHWKNIENALYPNIESIAPDAILNGTATYDKNGIPIIFFDAVDIRHKEISKVGVSVPINAKETNLSKWKILNNPVLQGTEIRDPFIWKDEELQKWFLILCEKNEKEDGKIVEYTSDNMNEWKYNGYLCNGEIRGSSPILLKIIDKIENRKRYILITENINKFDKKEIKYVIGDFDETTGKFLPDLIENKQKLINYGGTICNSPCGFVDPKTGRTILFTVAEGDRSATVDYKTGYSSNVIGLPLSLWLENGQLKIDAIDETNLLEKVVIANKENISLANANEVFENLNEDLVKIEFEIENISATKYGMKIKQSYDKSEETTILFDPIKSIIKIDRTKSTLDIDEKTSGDVSLEFSPKGTLKFKIYIDGSLAELFWGTEKIMTTRIYPLLNDSRNINMFADGEINIRNFSVARLQDVNNEYNNNLRRRYVAKDLFSSGLNNHDFADGTLNGWEIVKGNSFGDKGVTNKQLFWGGIKFNPSFSPVKYHFWGYANGGDKPTGIMQSQKFILGGDGQVNFLIGGGNDIENLYVAFIRVSDGLELYRVTGNDFEEYYRIFWDAAKYVGDEMYIKIVDNTTGEWGHINIGDFNVPVDLESKNEVKNEK